MKKYSFNDGEYVGDSYQECIDYLEQELSAVWKALKSIEMFYPSCEHYIVTEEDYNEAIKDYGRINN
jgi:hypothetical protein